MYKSREKIMQEKFSLKEVILLIVITALASLLTGFVITNKMLKDKPVEEKTTNSSALDSFIHNYKYIVENYYGNVDENKLLDKALAGVLEALEDPYTAFIDQSQVNNFNIQLEGSYKGLGIEIYNDSSGLRILAVFEDSPAAKAGLRPGDVIIKLNGNDVTDVSSHDFTNMVKNNGSGEQSLTVLRGDEEINLKVSNEIVTLKSAVSNIITKNDKKIGYLLISIFANNTYSQVKKELENLEASGIDSLIIDVRDNTGGHLTSVENILSLFLDSTHIIYRTEHNGKVDCIYSGGKSTKSYPIVVLTNQNSASASEILTVSLKEEYGATSVGKKTYGKGSAQELVSLPDGTQYKFTTKRWLSPKGNSIDNIGVDVDIEVELDESYKKNPSNENDNQLQAAINLIINT